MLDPLTSVISEQALAAMIIYLVLMISGCMACRSQRATSRFAFAAKLQRLLFAAWAAGEAVLGAVAPEEESWVDGDSVFENEWCL